MEGARVSLTDGVGLITGEGEAPMMGDDGEMGDMDDMDMEPTTDMDGEGDLDAELGGDDFDAAEPAAGGDEPEERAKRESIDPRRLAKTLSKNVKEGKVKDAMIGDSEKMTKAAFAKKYGKEAADEMYESKKK
jgi:hypothetical protein